MGQLWDIMQSWHDKQIVKPTWSKVADHLEVSQSSFETWKAPQEMPKRRTLFLIHDLTGVDFEEVVNAAINDVDLFDVTRAEEANRSYRMGKSDGRRQRSKQDESESGSQVDPAADPTASA